MTTWRELPSYKAGSSWYRRHRAANEKVRGRGEKISVVEEQRKTSSTEEKKAAIRARVLRMKEERQEKQKLSGISGGCGGRSDDKNASRSLTQVL